MGKNLVGMIDRIEDELARQDDDRRKAIRAVKENRKQVNDGRDGRKPIKTTK